MPVLHPAFDGERPEVRIKQPIIRKSARRRANTLESDICALRNTPAFLSSWG